MKKIFWLFKEYYGDFFLILSVVFIIISNFTGYKFLLICGVVQELAVLAVALTTVIKSKKCDVRILFFVSSVVLMLAYILKLYFGVYYSRNTRLSVSIPILVIQILYSCLWLKRHRNNASKKLLKKRACSPCDDAHSNFIFVVNDLRLSKGLFGFNYISYDACSANNIIIEKQYLNKLNAALWIGAFLSKIIYIFSFAYANERFRDYYYFRSLQVGMMDFREQWTLILTILILVEAVVLWLLSIFANYMVFRTFAARRWQSNSPPAADLTAKPSAQPQ